MAKNIKRDEASQEFIDQLFRLMKMRGVGKAFIEAQGGPCKATLRKWELGETRRPQLVTIRFAFRALGYDLQVVPMATHNIVPIQRKNKVG